MRVEVRTTLRRPGYPLRRAARFLNHALGLSGGSGREVSVLLCGDRSMRSLNRAYRGKDKSTDVLSFPATPGEKGFLGDLVVCLPQARRQARAGHATVAKTVDKLLLHGLLHLLGYDHETDRGEMEALEARLRRRLGTAP